MEERPENDRYCRAVSGLNYGDDANCRCWTFDPDWYDSKRCYRCLHSISSHEFRTDQQIGDFMAQEMNR